MRTIGIWASGLLASAIPFIFVGAVIAFGACIFDAVGQHAPPAVSRASSQTEAAPPEAAPPEQVLTVASANAPNDVVQRQATKHAHRNANARRHHHAGSPRTSRFYARVRPSPFEFGFGRLRAAVANQFDRTRVQ
jgi:hypothetical protein